MVLGLYLIADNLLPFLLAGQGGVAHGAHIGGFLAGAAVAWIMDRRGLAVRPSDIEAPATAGSGTDVIREALREGRYDEAASAYFALQPTTARGLVPPSEAVPLARWLRENDHPDAALTLLRRVTRDSPSAAGAADAYGLAGLILLEDRREVTAAYQYLLTAVDLGPSPEMAPAVRRGLAAIEAFQKRQVGRLHRPPNWLS
jgi:hypothetical protein